MGREDTKPLATQDLFPAQTLAEAIWVEPRESMLLSGTTGSNSPADGFLIVVTRVACDASVCKGLREGDTVTALGGAPVFALTKVLQAEKATYEASDRPADPVEAELQDLSYRRRLATIFGDALLKKANKQKMVALAWRKTGSAAATTSNVAQNASSTLLGKGASIAALGRGHQRWREATASYRFFDGIWSSIKSCEEVPKTCPVCFIDFDAANSGSILHCGHLFCSQCSARMFTNVSTNSPVPCPLCRYSVQTQKDVFDVGYFAQKKHEARTNTINGTKLDKIADAIQQIVNGSEEERIIIFCQFADLEERISIALRAVGIRHVRLSETRSVFEQTAMLEDFQQKRDDASRVLLLSLEQSASGTNLTAANHVFLVHPMAAETPQRAAAFEQQAIGRVRRLGQMRTVNIWRFVTQGTVEEDLHNRLNPWRAKASHNSAADRRPLVQRRGHAETQPRNDDPAPGPVPATIGTRSSQMQVQAHPQRSTMRRASGRVAGSGQNAARRLSLQRRSTSVGVSTS